MGIHISTLRVSVQCTMFECLNHKICSFESYTIDVFAWLDWKLKLYQVEAGVRLSVPGAVFWARAQILNLNECL